MSDIIVNKKKWKLWNPKNMNNLLDDKYLDKELLKNEKDKIYKIAYEKGLQKGREEGYNLKFRHKELHIISLKNDVYVKMKKFLSELKNAIQVLDKKIANKLLEIAFKISSKILNNTIVLDKNKILNMIQEMLLIHFEYKNIKLTINPNDKIVVKEYFSKLFNIYNYIILYDKNIAVGGCKIEFSNGELDCTSITKWKELCRLFCFQDNI